MFFPGNGASIPCRCSHFGDVSSPSRSSSHLVGERSEMFVANNRPTSTRLSTPVSQFLMKSSAPLIFSLDDSSVNLPFFLFYFERTHNSNFRIEGGRGEKQTKTHASRKRRRIKRSPGPGWSPTCCGGGGGGGGGEDRCDRRGRWCC